MGVMSPTGRLTVLEQSSNTQNRTKVMRSLPRPATVNAHFMTYQSLTAELDQEKSALEDLHMFFVAFYKRQRNIIERADAINNEADD